MTRSLRQAEDARGVLDYMVSDLVATTHLYSMFLKLARRAKSSDDTVIIARRIYVSYLMLCLTKFLEFYDRYERLIPPDCKNACRDVYEELTRREIKDLRNTFIGHIWNKKTGRPISSADVEAKFQTATGSDPKAFLDWIHRPGAIVFPDTVVSVVERTRDRITAVYSLHAEMK